MSHIKLKCNECEAEVIVQVGEFEFESVDVDERQMGPEVTYEGTVETECPNGHSTEVIHRYWEYPVGAENHKETEVPGLKCKKTPYRSEATP